MVLPAPAGTTAVPAPHRVSSQPSRLVTLSGVGGSGKTRLAVELASGIAEGRGRPGRLRDGVRWVGLAAVTDAAELPWAAAAALGLRAAAGARPLEALASALADQQVLLVLDNCEHLLDACRSFVTSLLRANPRVALLLTSRMPLHLDDETVFAVPSLGVVASTPGGVSLDGTGADEATQLFLDRAAMATPGYRATESTTNAVTSICERLGGLPLAIELAAGWMRVLTAGDLLAEIERSIDVLSSSATIVDERHRSMRAVLESAWERLSEHDQRVLSTLAVFPADFSREAAEVVCGATLSALSALTETYLIQRIPASESETRYHMHNLVRQFAAERLDATDGQQWSAAKLRHCDYFLALAERAEEVWDTALEAQWLDRLTTEQSNVDAAVRWAIDEQLADRALRFASGLFTFWIYTTPLARYSAIVEQVVSLPWDTAAPEVSRARARALNVAGYAAVIAADFDRARRLFDEGLQMSAGLVDDPATAWALRGRGLAGRLAGDLAAARADVERSLAICRAAGDARGAAWSVHDQGEIAFADGELDRAEQLLLDGLQRFEELGVAFGAYRAGIMLGDVHLRRARWQEARARYDQALVHQRQLHFVSQGGDILEGLGGVAVGLHDHVAAAQLFGAGAAWRKTFGFDRYQFNEKAFASSVATAQRVLGAKRWSESYAEGNSLTAEEAMEEAHRCSRELAHRRPEDELGLTSREMEVLRAVALGLGSSDIAAQLGVSTRTVHAHLRSIFTKLNVSSRTAAVHEAVSRHLI